MAQCLRGPVVAIAWQRLPSGKIRARNGLPDDTSVLEPPDPFPNSAVKRLSADGSVGSPHVRVGRRQAFTKKPRLRRGFFVAAALPA